MNRSELKSIVKECLVEILMEGVGTKSPPKARVNETNLRAASKQDERAKPNRNRPGLDLIHHGAPARSQAAPSPARDPMASFAKELAGGNDVMASIFADTARTTLAEQGLNESSRPSNPVVDTGIDPMEMFSSSKNWEFLAFSGKETQGD